MAKYEKEPTVWPASPFNAAEDAATLRSAMKGLGTDEDAIIDVLTARCNSQRQDIAAFYNQEYGRDIIDDLKSELGGKFEDVIVGLMLPPDEFLCKQLHKAMDGIGTEESTLIEILCSRSNKEMKTIVDTYERMYDRPLAEHMCGETGGDLRRLLTLIVTGTRDESREVDASEAREQAEKLYQAGEGKLGTDEEVFNKILAHENFDQLKQVFEEYKEISGNTIEQALRHELDGDLLDAMLAIVECVQCPPAFFARRVYDAMDGAGTDDTTLIRVIVSRSEIDLGTVKKEFERIYDKTMDSFVRQGETSGDYKHALLALINGP